MSRARRGYHRKPTADGGRGTGTPGRTGRCRPARRALPADIDPAPAPDPAGSSGRAAGSASDARADPAGTGSVAFSLMKAMVTDLPRVRIGE